MAIEQWRFFSVPHLLGHGAFVYNGYLRGPDTLTPVAERLSVELSLPFLRLSCVAAGIRTPNLRGERSSPLRHRRGCRLLILLDGTALYQSTFFLLTLYHFPLMLIFLMGAHLLRNKKKILYVLQMSIWQILASNTSMVAYALGMWNANLFSDCYHIGGAWVFYWHLLTILGGRNLPFTQWCVKCKKIDPYDWLNLYETSA